MDNEMSQEEENAILTALGENDTETPSEEQEEASVEVETEVVEEPEDEKPVPLKALTEERRKRQDLEKRLEEIERGQKAVPQPPPKDIYEAYDRDAQGVTTQLNAQIKKLVEDDPYANAAQIEQLRDLKDDLRRREVQNIQKQLNSQTEAQKAITYARQAIPDLDAVIPALQEFAMTELEYTPQELFDRINIEKGLDGAKELVRLYKMYQKVHAKPQVKETRPRPTAVEPAGKVTQKVEQDVNALMREAQRTGNWEKVFEAKGLL